MLFQIDPSLNYSGGGFTHYDTTSLSFWMDNAPSHFRNLETMPTFEEINAKGMAVEIAEYHGKLTASSAS